MQYKTGKCILQLNFPEQGNWCGHLCINSLIGNLIGVPFRLCVYILGREGRKRVGLRIKRASYLSRQEFGGAGEKGDCLDF